MYSSFLKTFGLERDQIPQKSLSRDLSIPFAETLLLQGTFCRNKNDSIAFNRIYSSTRLFLHADSIALYVFFLFASNALYGHIMNHNETVVSVARQFPEHFYKFAFHHRDNSNL